jgi:DNA primase
MIVIDHISAEQLAAVVRKRVVLKRCGARWWGLCPFHRETDPSFYVWTGRRGEGRYHCLGCGADGDDADWMRIFENHRFTKDELKPDPAEEQRRRQVKRKRRIRSAFYDIYPDACPEWSIIIDGLFKGKQ